MQTVMDTVRLGPQRAKTRAACADAGAWLVGRDIRKGDLWRSARNARKRARQVIRAAGDAPRGVLDAVGRGEVVQRLLPHLRGDERRHGRIIAVGEKDGAGVGADRYRVGS